MIISDLKNKMVAVLGYGQEGQAIARYLQKHQVNCVLFDQKSLESFRPEVQAKLKDHGQSFIFGPDCFKELSGFQIAFRSPGINRNNKELLEFEKKGLVITSQTKFFFESCFASIIGVTGTKGKGTTSTLIYKMLEANGNKAVITGNIGGIQPLEVLDDLSSDQKIVYELSSFQLEDLNLSPHIGVVLMVTSEHLDYHLNVSAYRASKEAITKYQSKEDFAIFNSDYEASKIIGEAGLAKKIQISTRHALEEGCWIEDEEIKYSQNGKTISLLKIDKVGLRGRHNLENLCAAVAAAAILEINEESIRKVVEEFKGLEHRLELVKTVGGVAYYNDSYSTTPETAIAAITSFNEPLVLILGGSEKNSDFSELGQAATVARNIKKIILVGESAPRIKQAILEAGGEDEVFLEGAKNMQEIINLAKATATPGSVVLLSPACASFGMFTNYKQRGEEFKKIVTDL